MKESSSRLPALREIVTRSFILTYKEQPDQLNTPVKRLGLRLLRCSVLWSG
jgi:hypothetical protein